MLGVVGGSEATDEASKLRRGCPGGAGKAPLAQRRWVGRRRCVLVGSGSGGRG